MITEKNLNITQKIIKKLEKVDWDFELSSSKGDITSIHPYPARFIPSIPKTILDAVSQERDSIKLLDPFAGCGTALTEAQLFGAETIGIDVNGLANFLQQVYTGLHNTNDLKSFLNLIEVVDKKIRKRTREPAENIDIPNLEHWFDAESTSIVSQAIKTVNKGPFTERAKMYGLMGISRVLITLSRQKSDTQYVAVDKELDFDRKIAILINSLKFVYEHLQLDGHIKRQNAICIHGDSREESTFTNINDVNLVVTSPPYPNAYEYWLYHKYRMYWLGMDPIYSRTNEIGTRPHYSGSGKKNELDFYRDVQAVLTNIDRVTSKDALQFWVVGESIIKGKKVNNTEIVINAAEGIGWKNIATFHRSINRRRSSFQGIGNKELEDIIVLSR